MDKMIIEIQKAKYDNIYRDGVWLRDNDRNASDDAIDAMNDLKNILSGISGLIYQGVFVSSTNTVATEEMQFVSREAKYGSEVFLTLAQATQLRSTIMTNLVGSVITAYKDIFVRSTRNDNTPSSLYFGHIVSLDGLEIYVFDITYKTKVYLDPSGTDNMDDFLAEINTNIDTISGLEYGAVVGSSSKGAINQLFFGLDDAIYNGSKYLTPIQIVNLRNAIINVLDSINNINSYGEVVVITSRKDSQPSTNYYN